MNSVEVLQIVHAVAKLAHENQVLQARIQRLERANIHLQEQISGVRPMPEVPPAGDGVDPECSCAGR